MINISHFTCLFCMCVFFMTTRKKKSKNDNNWEWFKINMSCFNLEFTKNTITFNFKSHNFHKNKSLIWFPPLFADFWNWEQDAMVHSVALMCSPPCGRPYLVSVSNSFAEREEGGRGNVIIFVNSSTFVVVVYWVVI